MDKKISTYVKRERKVVDVNAFIEIMSILYSELT